MHGGVALDALTVPDPSSVERGLDNLAAHLDAAAHFDKPTLVAINQFHTDTAEELKVVHDFLPGPQRPLRHGLTSSARGGTEAIDLAEKVVAATSGPLPATQNLVPARMVD